MDKHSKDTTLVKFLQGTDNATFAKDEAGMKADVYTFKYILADRGKKNDKRGKDRNRDDVAAT